MLDLFNNSFPKRLGLIEISFQKMLELLEMSPPQIYLKFVLKSVGLPDNRFLF